VGADVLQYGVATLVFAGVTMLDNVLTSPFSYAHHAVALAFHDLAHVRCQSSQLKSDLWDEADIHNTCIHSIASVCQSVFMNRLMACEQEVCGFAKIDAHAPCPWNSKTVLNAVGCLQQLASRVAACEQDLR